MHFEVSEHNINQLVITDEDICFNCILKYDCALICGLTSGFVSLTEKDDILKDCNIFDEIEENI